MVEKGKKEAANELTDNDIGDFGARIIGEALKYNTTLTKLNLAGIRWFRKNNESKDFGSKNKGRQQI